MFESVIFQENSVSENVVKINKKEQWLEGYNFFFQQHDVRVVQVEFDVVATEENDTKQPFTASHVRYTHIGSLANMNRLRYHMIRSLVIY